MGKYKVLTVTTRYWRPGKDYLQEIIAGVEGKISDKDFVVVSEKAISTAMGNIIDESAVEPSLAAELIAGFWMRTVWGYFLGSLCHLRKSLIQCLREYPSELGSSHKQFVLQRTNLLQALMFGSEGGIDGSNLAGSYVSLPLRNPDETAQRICEQIRTALQKNVSVMIVDTDKTYSLRNFHFTPRPKPLKGIHSFGGVCTYMIGRMLKLRKRATPTAMAGCKVSVEDALEIAEAANCARGFGAGRNVWDMATRFQVGVDEVSWQMLETVRHKPIVIVRSKR
jgi:F420-0:gamma-glutamyl ligase-like protein